MKTGKIQKVIGREILDSRGNPTVEAEVILSDGTRGRGMVPSGASTGEFEALELRDQDQRRYLGKGVQKAVSHIENELSQTLVGMEMHSLYDLDQAMIRADGTKDKSKLGANGILALSIALARAGAASYKLPLYQYLGGIQGITLPVPLMNIINGGAHAKNTLDFQEFMIVPLGACCFHEALRMGTEVYHHLKKVLEARGLSSAVGDEGGFAPDCHGVKDALDFLMEAVKKAGFQPGEEICFAMDVAASEWKSKEGKGYYSLPKAGKTFCSEELIDMYGNMIQNYPIVSIEDPLDEEDWDGWKKITRKLGERIQLVGDDLFVTNTERLKRGMEEGCGNSILIKVNQIGTLSETMEAIRMAHRGGYRAIVSHRSGETEDTTIADLAVALNAGQIKTGAPCRSERTAKYNQLLRIEEELGERAVYGGRDSFFIQKKSTCCCQ